MKRKVSNYQYDLRVKGQGNCNATHDLNSSFIFMTDGVHTHVNGTTFVLQHMFFYHCYAIGVKRQGQKYLQPVNYDVLRKLPFHT